MQDIALRFDILSVFSLTYLRSFEEIFGRCLKCKVLLFKTVVKAPLNLYQMYLFLSFTSWYQFLLLFRVFWKKSRWRSVIFKSGKSVILSASRIFLYAYYFLMFKILYLFWKVTIYELFRKHCHASSFYWTALLRAFAAFEKNVSKSKGSKSIELLYERVYQHVFCFCVSLPWIIHRSMKTCLWYSG